MVEKKRLRQELLQKRQALSTQQWEDKSQAICQYLAHYLQHSALVPSGGVVLSYFYFRQEPNLDPLFELEDYRWGVPRCVGNQLSWHCWQPGDELVKSRYGIREPREDALICSPETVNLIFVPAVACDRHGYRLGYGGGFYDRLFHESQWQEIPKIGIIFDLALVPELPVDSWDVPLDGVCTEQGWQVTTPRLKLPSQNSAS